VQLTAIGKEAWRAAKQAEGLDQAGAGDPAVFERLRKLRLVEALRKRGANRSEIQGLVGISRATYYRYRQRLEREGLKGLRPRSRRPKRLRRKVYWTSECLIAIEALRKQCPAWGRLPILQDVFASQSSGTPTSCDHLAHTLPLTSQVVPLEANTTTRPWRVIYIVICDTRI